MTSTARKPRTYNPPTVALSKKEFTVGFAILRFIRFLGGAEDKAAELRQMPGVYILMLLPGDYFLVEMDAEQLWKRCSELPANLLWMVT